MRYIRLVALPLITIALLQASGVGVACSGLEPSDYTRTSTSGAAEKLSGLLAQSSAKQAWATEPVTPWPTAHGPVPFLVFKKARSGSTWMASLLRNDPNFLWFVDEMQSCNRNADNQRSTEIVQYAFRHPKRFLRPDTWNSLCPDKKWLKKTDASLELARAHGNNSGSFAVGFSYNPEHKLCKLDKRGWGEVVSGRYPERARLVHYVRTNLVKRVVSIQASRDLFHRCHSLKTLAPRDIRCASHAGNKTEVHVKRFLRELRRTARMYQAQRQLADELAQQGRAVYTLTYEELQQDAPGAVEALLQWGGVAGAVRGRGLSRSVDVHPSEDLRARLTNFADLERALRPYPCFHRQLVSTRVEVFPPCFMPPNLTQRLMEHNRAVLAAVASAALLWLVCRPPTFLGVPILTDGPVDTVQRLA